MRLTAERNLIQQILRLTYTQFSLFLLEQIKIFINVFYVHYYIMNLMIEQGSNLNIYKYTHNLVPFFF